MHARILFVRNHPRLMCRPAANRALMPSSSSGSLVRDTAMGLGPVLLLWGAYLALQLSDEGRARCSPVYFAIPAVQARTSAVGPLPCA